MAQPITNTSIDGCGDVDLNERCSLMYRPSSPSRIEAGLELGMQLQLTQTQEEEPSNKKKNNREEEEEEEENRLVCGSKKLSTTIPIKKLVCLSMPPPPPSLYYSQSAPIGPSSQEESPSAASSGELLKGAEDFLIHDEAQNDIITDAELDQARRLAQMLDEATRDALSSSHKNKRKKAEQQEEAVSSATAAEQYGYGYEDPQNEPQQQHPPLLQSQSCRGSNKRQRRRYPRRNSFVIHRNRAGPGWNSLFGPSSCPLLPAQLPPSSMIGDNQDHELEKEATGTTTTTTTTTESGEQLGPLGFPHHESKLVLQSLRDNWELEYQQEQQQLEQQESAEVYGYGIY